MASFFDRMHEAPVELGQPYPIPGRLSLETTSYCNRSCSFCPVSKGTRDYRKSMDPALYTSIVEQLAQMGFNGFASLFMLNEPLLDRHLFERARELRLACPKVTIYISTNGDVVDKVGLQVLEDAYQSGINSINLNVYDSGPEQHLRFTQLIEEMQRTMGVRLTDHKYQKQPARSRVVALTDMRVDRLTASKTDQFFDRSDVDRMRNLSVPQTYCARPQRHLVVYWNGVVPTCCALDPTANDTPIMGDASRQPLLQIWNSEAMHRYRWFTQQKRRVLPGCDTCTHQQAYAHVVRKVTAPPETIERWERSVVAYQRAKEAGTVQTPREGWQPS